MKSNEKIYLITVVNDYAKYDKYVKKNPYNSNFTLIEFDNTNENIGIAQRYNEFLENYTYSEPAWFVFCHQDWELDDDLETILSELSHKNIYGPVGAKLISSQGKYGKFLIGAVDDITPDGTKSSKIRSIKEKFEPVDTLDCQCIIFHSSLIKDYQLRFDNAFMWDLYSEDFSINAKIHYNIDTFAIKLYCIHHSEAGFKELPLSFHKALEYFNKKYPEGVYASTCTVLGKKCVQKLSDKECAFHFIRQRMNINKENKCLKFQ